MKKNNISTLQNPKSDHNLFTVFTKSGEAEIWLKPCDPFKWDNQMVEKKHNFFANANILAIEVYLLTILARADRSSIDISDILNILIANNNKIDWECLIFRLRWIGLEGDFKQILKGYKLDAYKNVRNNSKEILKKFKSIIET